MNRASDNIDPESLFSEVHDLVTAQAEGRLTSEQAERLQALVCSNPAARRLYVHYVRETASLHWWASGYTAGDPTRDAVRLDSGEPGGNDGSESGWPAVGALDETMVLPALQDDLSAEADDAIEVPHLPRPVPRISVMRRLLSGRVVWALAAGVLLILGLTAALLLRDGDRAAAPVATLASTIEAHWDAARPAPRPGDALPPGAFGLTGGVARIRFGDGAEVVVQGPARFELLSTSMVRLLEGRLTAHVPPPATRFTVRTPAADVVDIGTRFGVIVEPGGATEAHVIAGRVRLESAAGGRPHAELAAAQASRIESAGAPVTAITFAPDQFLQQPQTVVIDLADVVAGGDGTQGRRGRGINPADGSTGSPSDGEGGLDRMYLRGDGRFRPVAGLPFVAGVFIPAAGAAPTQLDPAGHTFAEFGTGDSLCWNWLWSGPVPREHLDQSEIDPAVLDAIPSTLGGVDYAAAGRSMLYINSNQGVAFDLSAMRARHPRAPISRFRGVCGNLAGGVRWTGTGPTRADFWVFVDGRLRLRRTLRATLGENIKVDPPFKFDVPLDSHDRYLTVVVTDGGPTGRAEDPSIHVDWVALGDPRLE